MSVLFDAVRHITAIDAAERAGIPMVRRGSSYWACCPLHGEKTPSLKFYEGDRGWTCFGCHKGGDAIKLYEELYRVEPVEAARITLDCEARVAHKSGVLAGLQVDLSEWPVLVPGANAISWTGAVTSVSISPRWRWL